MWVHAGFSPDAFWQQTPRHFQLAMDGVRRRLKDEGDERTRGAWETAAFNAATKTKRGLKPLHHYLSHKAAPTPQTSAQMLAILKSMNAPGMKFERRKPGQTQE